MLDLKIDEEKAQEVKTICFRPLEKRTGIMKKTQFKAEDVFADILWKDSKELNQIKVQPK